MNEKISVLVATRGRPDNDIRLLNSIKETAFDLNTVEVLFRVDDNDNATRNLEELIPKNMGFDVRVLRDRQTSISDSWNDCWRASTGSIYFLCGDDIVFSSKDWDKQVRSSFNKYPDRLILVFGKDGLFSGNFASHPFIHKNWTDILGYFTPPGYMCRNDLWLWEIASEVGRTEFNKNIYTEHMHYEMKKAVLDDSYKLMRTRYDNETNRYNSESPKRKEAAEKIKEKIQNNLEIVNLESRRNFWAEKHAKPFQVTTDISLLIQKIEIFRGKSVLEIGPGEGKQYEKIKPVSREYYIADICQKVVSDAFYSGVKGYQIKSYLSYLGKTFNVVHFWNVVHHLLPEELNMFFGFVRRHVDLNGFVLFNYPDVTKYPENLVNDGITTSAIRKEHIEQICSKHFEIVEQVSEETGYNIVMRAK